MPGLWRNGYGAIPQSARDEDTESSVPGPENVKTIPDRWRNAWAWIIFLLVPRPDPTLSRNVADGPDHRPIGLFIILTLATHGIIDI